MARYFSGAKDLVAWIINEGSPERAAEKLNTFLTSQGAQEQLSIIEACRAIFNDKKDEKSAEVLMQLISKYTDENTTKKVVTAQTETRQKNEWEHGMRNKWSRITHQYNDGTPWRLQRDQMYDKTHYATDEIKFDSDPNHIYSGEAIWRMYIMDKYSAEQQDENGKWVGGYINDRFYVFPTAGTPANPDVPRDGGNQLQLKPNERTRKPRKQTWSTERRLEEARGNKLEDLMVTTASTVKTISKISSKILAPERNTSKTYQVFKDSLDMKEAGFDYENRIIKISEHYHLPLTYVAQIDAVAQKLAAKHDGLFYELEKTALARHNETFVANVDLEAIDVNTNQPTIIPSGSTLIAQTNPEGTIYHINDGADAGKTVAIHNISGLSSRDNDVDGHLIQDAALDVGLDESPEDKTPVEVSNPVENSNNDDFPIEDMSSSEK